MCTQNMLDIKAEIQAAHLGHHKTAQI